MSELPGALNLKTAVLADSGINVAANVYTERKAIFVRWTVQVVTIMTVNNNVVGEISNSSAAFMVSIGLTGGQGVGKMSGVLEQSTVRGEDTGTELPASANTNQDG